MSVGASKNLGVEEAQGEILLFVDADEMICDGYIETLINPIIKGKTLATVPYFEANGRRTNFRGGVFSAIKKDVF